MTGSVDGKEIQAKINEIVLQAKQSIAAGDHASAEKLLQDALIEQPNDADANFQSGLLDLETKGSEFALPKFEIAVSNKPQIENYWIKYIKTLMQSATLETVLSALELGQQYALSEQNAQGLADMFLKQQELTQENPTTPKDAQATLKQSTFTQGYQYNTADNFYHPSTQDAFAYKDSGDAQNRLYNIIKRAKDRSVFSPELMGQGADWPTYYHLTPLRSNILRPFIDELSAGRTLELGAGCGAVTRFIGEVGGDVVALEGSPDRARVIGTRCADLDNVTVIADLIQNYDTSEKFDVVTLIGVLEYAQVYVDEPNPIQFLINKAKSFLSEDGILIIAIENQLGLKYFCGSAEDHLGRAMYGINDSYTDKTPITFGRKVLTKHIKNAGFEAVDLYVPLPDYKTPVSIIYPKGFDDEAEAAGFDVSPILAGSAVHDRQAPPVPVFSLESAWGVIGANGLGQDMANSFLFVARNKPKTEQATVLAAHYGCERVSKFAKETQFILDNMQVHTQTRMVGNTDNLNTQKWDIAPYRVGTLWFDELQKLMNRPDWTFADINAWAKVWINALNQQEKAKASDTIQELKHFNTLLPAHFIDATPTNMIVNHLGNGEFFDLEWNFSIALPIEFIVYRCLFLTLHRVTSCARPANDVPMKLIEITHKIMHDAGFSVSQDDQDLFDELFNAFQNKVQGIDGPAVNSLRAAMDHAELRIRQLFT